MVERFIIKRDGRKVKYDKNKIFNAILAAYEEVYPDFKYRKIDCMDITDEVDKFVEDGYSVEDVQDLIENALMEEYPWVAKAFICYRYKRALARDDYNALMSSVAEKLGAKNIENQNANVDEKSFGGRLGSMCSAVSKYYSLNYLMSPLAKRNHEENKIYTHDLDHYAVGDHNCMSIPIDPLLKNGFNTRQTDVRPANSISTAFQLLAVIDQLQSLQQFGN